MPPPSDSLALTVAAAARGDQEAWRRLVGDYSRRVLGLIARQCGDRDLAEEITQATFVRVVEKLDRYEEEGQFEPWLFRIAMNLLRDEMRRRGRQARNLDEEEQPWSSVQNNIVARAPRSDQDPLAQLDAQEQASRLRSAMDQLSDADREILTLRHTAGLTFAQIAQSLEQPLGTVLARGHRALAKLRKIMEEPT